MKNNYMITMLLVSFFYLNYSFCQSPNYIKNIHGVSSVKYNNDRITFNRHQKTFDEVIDSTTIYMRVDTEYMISEDVFWDTMYFFYFQYDSKNRPVSRSSQTLLNTYYSGKKQVFEKAKFIWNDEDLLIREISLRERAGGFDTLTFSNYYNDFSELDSVILEVTNLGNQYLVRRDLYEYDDNKLLNKISRYVLDDNGNWVLGVLYKYNYYSDINKPSNIITEDYYLGEVEYSYKDSFYYNSNGQTDSVYFYFRDLGADWELGTVEKYFYSSPNQFVPDSVRYFDIVEDKQDFSSVQYFFRRKPNKISDILKNKINCKIPNPYKEGLTIECIEGDELFTNNAIINIYNMNGILIKQLPFTKILTHLYLLNSDQYIFTIKDKNNNLIYSKPFVYLK